MQSFDAVTANATDTPRSVGEDGIMTNRQTLWSEYECQAMSESDVYCEEADIKFEADTLFKMANKRAFGGRPDPHAECDEDTISLLDRHQVYSFVPYGKLAWHPFRFVSFALIGCWGLFMVALWMTKEIAEGSDNTFWTYLTNWSWVLQAIFWTAKFLGYVESLITYRYKDVPNYIIYHVYYWLFWPTLMVNTGVTWVVLLVLYDSPGLLVNYFDEFGPGFVFLMNFIFHVATYILMVSELVLTYEDLMYMLNRSLVSLIRYFFTMFAIANTFLLMYLALHNIHDVYGLDDFSYWFVILMFEFVIFVPNSIVMGVLSPLKFMYRTGFSLSPLMLRNAHKYEVDFV